MIKSKSKKLLIIALLVLLVIVLALIIAKAISPSNDQRIKQGAGDVSTEDTKQKRLTVEPRKDVVDFCGTPYEADKSVYFENTNILHKVASIATSNKINDRVPPAGPRFYLCDELSGDLNGTIEVSVTTTSWSVEPAYRLNLTNDVFFILELPNRLIYKPGESGIHVWGKF